MKRFAWLLLPMLLAGFSAGAEEKVPDQLRDALKTLIPDRKADRIVPTVVPGLYEITYGSHLFYLSADGRYLVKGDIVDLANGINLTEARLGEQRLAALKGLDESTMIVYPAKGETKHTITVFTDIDCGYCRKLHGGMEEMNKLGIRVRYLAFPRADVGSESYKKAVTVWCSEDRNAAMNKAKQGESLPERTCDHPLAKHMALVKAFGLNGTPAIILESGELLPGYLSPQRLLQALEGKD